MATVKINYTFVRGDTQYLKKFRLLDRQGNVIQLTSSNSLTFTMKEDDEKDSKIILQKTIGNGIEELPDNYYRIILHPEDTENLEYHDLLINDGYKYDIEFRDEASSPMYVKTIINGLIKLTSEITRMGGGN